MQPPKGLENRPYRIRLTDKEADYWGFVGMNESEAHPYDYLLPHWNGDGYYWVCLDGLKELHSLSDYYSDPKEYEPADYPELRTWQRLRAKTAKIMEANGIPTIPKEY